MIFYHLARIAGLVGAELLYSDTIGFDDHAMCFPHNALVASYIATVYCFIGLFIQGKVRGFAHPVRSFVSWVKGEAEHDETGSDEKYFDKNKGWIYGFYYALIFLLANFIFAFLRLIHILYIFPP